MGAGKTTATRRLAQRIGAAGQSVEAITEAADLYPVRASDDLPDFFAPWDHVDAGSLAHSAREKWRRFVEARVTGDGVVVIDGQLFHGDLTHLFLMEWPEAAIEVHVRKLVGALAPLRPFVLYLRPREVAAAVRMVAAERGGAWVAYQTAWKLRSPYALRRGLAGIDGLVSLYEDYRAVTDRLFRALECDKLSIDTSGREWPAYEERVAATLRDAGLPL